MAAERRFWQHDGCASDKAAAITERAVTAGTRGLQHCLPPRLSPLPDSRSSPQSEMKQRREKTCYWFLLGSYCRANDCLLVRAGRRLLSAKVHAEALALWHKPTATLVPSPETGRRAPTASGWPGPGPRRLWGRNFLCTSTSISTLGVQSHATRGCLPTPSGTRGLAAGQVMT